MRSEHRVTLGLEARQDEDRRAAASCDRDLFLLGSWHTHPFAKGYEAPSSTDRRNSLARLDRPDGESWVPATSFGLDLIVCPDGRRGYSKPHYFLWLTERSRLSGCGVTVPACFPETLSNW